MNPLSSLNMKKNNSHFGGNTLPSPMLLKGESIKDESDLFPDQYGLPESN